MALTGPKPRNRRGNGQVGSAPIVTNQTVHVGSLVAFTNATGRVRASATTSGRIAGVVIALDRDGANNSGTGVGNTGGTETARFAYLDEHELTIATAARTNTSLGKTVFMADDDTVRAAVTGGVPVGELAAFSTSDKSKGWVAPRRYAATDA